MRIVSKLGLMLAMAVSLLVSSCAGSYYVAAQPVEPVYERPIAPYAGAVWIDGEWAWAGGRYVYTRGYWARPRPGRNYVRGYWAPRRHGYGWHRGYWR